MKLHEKSTTAEAAVLAALAQRRIVLIPFGEGLPYDLVLDESGTGVFNRIQCKTGILRDGAVRFNTRSNDRDYAGLVDSFGVYCPQNGQVYLVPKDHVGCGMAHLRIEPAKNGQEKNVRLASEYVLGTVQVQKK